VAVGGAAGVGASWVIVCALGSMRTAQSNLSQSRRRGTLLTRVVAKRQPRISARFAIAPRMERRLAKRLYGLDGATALKAVWRPPGNQTLIGSTDHAA
jgi:hypothetical protein